jgi:hypothetical protein
VHQRHVQVGERGHRATAAIGRQPGDAGAFEQELEQFGLRENPRDQLAVLEVVARQGGLVLGEHAVDFVHALVRVEMSLPSPSRVCATFSRLNDSKLQVAERSASMPSMISRPAAAAK